MQLTTKRFYDSICLLSPNLVPIALISKGRAEFYLSKGLGQENGPFKNCPRSIRLLFEPKKIHPIVAEPTPNYCVVCGENEDLGHCSVIPDVIKKLWPEEEKDHDHYWHVLLCFNCREKLTKGHNNILFNLLKERNKLLNTRVDLVSKARAGLARAKRNKYLDGIPQEKVNILLKKANYKDISEIDENFVYQFIIPEESWEAAEKLSLNFTENTGGFSAVRELFKKEFLKLQPKFLPDYFLPDKEKMG